MKSSPSTTLLPSCRSWTPESKWVEGGGKGRFTGKNKGGAELDTGFEHILEMRDRKVVRFEEQAQRRRGVGRGLDQLTPLFDEPAGTDRG